MFEISSIVIVVFKICKIKSDANVNNSGYCFVDMK